MVTCCEEMDSGSEESASFSLGRGWARTVRLMNGTTYEGSDVGAVYWDEYKRTRYDCLNIR